MGKSQEILERAQELLDDGKESLEAEVLESESQDNKDSDNISDSMNHEVDEEDKIFTVPLLGYRRLTHYKKPSIYKIAIGVIIIVVIFYLIGLILPFTPPVLA